MPKGIAWIDEGCNNRNWLATPLRRLNFALAAAAAAAAALQKSAIAFPLWFLPFPLVFWLNLRCPLLLRRRLSPPPWLLPRHTECSVTTAWFVTDQCQKLY